MSTDHTEKYTLPIAQSESAPGADWANSLLTIEFASTDTVNMTYQGAALIEIQVDDTVNTTGKTTFFVKVLIVSGLLP